MDLRRSASPPPSPDLTFAIPAARQPFPQLAMNPPRDPSAGAVLRLGSTGAPAQAAFRVRLRHGVNLAEGALVLIGAYILIGAGIGEAAGSVVIGVAAGLIAGLCAIAAILLITGSAQAARAANDRGARRVPQVR